MKPRNEGSAWVERFPDATREFRILSNKSFWWNVKQLIRRYVSRFIAWLFVLVGFAIACIVILIIMGLLKALGVKEL